MVKKVIINLHLSKTSGYDCIPVVVLKNGESELSSIIAEFFNKFFKDSCFPDCWKVSSVIPVFKNVGKRSKATNYRSVSLLSVFSKVFEKKNLMAPFYGWGSTTSTLKPLRGGSLLFTIQFP